jgi:hypothetical protein
MGGLQVVLERRRWKRGSRINVQDLKELLA